MTAKSVWTKHLPSLTAQAGKRLHLQHVRAYTPPAIAGVTEDEVRAARNHCSDLLRRYDVPAFTLQTYVPTHARDAYLALRAFNVDVARVADATSNPAVGAMRMQFWRDSITKALDFAPPKEPVAVLLCTANAQLAAQTEGKSKLSKAWLHRIVSTREQYLHNPPYTNMSALESYAENTYSTLMYLTLSALPLASVTADHVASHIGKAQGIAAVLRGLPLLAFPPPPNMHSNQGAFGGAAQGDSRQGSVMLPLDVMADAGVREAEVLRKGADATGLRDAVFAVATRANDHLITAREMLKNLRAGQEVGHDFEHQDDVEHQSQQDAVNRGAQGHMADVERGFGVFMPAIATQEWLDRLQSYDFDVFQPKLRTSGWRLPLKSYWAFSKRQL